MGEGRHFCFVVFFLVLRDISRYTLATCIRPTTLHLDLCLLFFVFVFTDQ